MLGVLLYICEVFGLSQRPREHIICNDIRVSDLHVCPLTTYYHSIIALVCLLFKKEPYVCHLTSYYHSITNGAVNRCNMAM